MPKATKLRNAHQTSADPHEDNFKTSVIFGIPRIHFNIYDTIVSAVLRYLFLFHI